MEFAALFTGAGVAHLLVTALGQHESGAVTLVGLGAVLCMVVTVNLWWTHRLERDPANAAEALSAEAPQGPTLLWRVRARVRETPGQLAALAAATAASGGNILSLSTQPDPYGTVDELFVQMPHPVPGEVLVTALTSAGGRSVRALPATMHELVDPVTRALLLASSVRADHHRLPTALATLLDARIMPTAATGHNAQETLLLPSHSDHPIRLHRPGMPFTATETARALALLEHVSPAKHPRENLE